MLCVARDSEHGSEAKIKDFSKTPGCAVQRMRLQIVAAAECCTGTNNASQTYTVRGHCSVYAMIHM
jgi:hypothetical protein